MALTPLVLFLLIKPEVTATPQAPAAARLALRALGPLTRDLVVPFGLTSLRLDVATSQRIVRAATRRAHQHNAARRFVEQALFDALAASARETVDSATVRERVRHTDEVRAALEWMWPVLTPAQLLHDLFGSAALLRLAARNSFDDDEIARLVRARSATVEEVRWTDADIPLLDEALAVLGPKPARAGHEAEEIRTYGHIVIDEAQDLTPMALRMISRRSLNGSITMVGGCRLKMRSGLKIGAATASPTITPATAIAAKASGPRKPNGRRDGLATWTTASTGGQGSAGVVGRGAGAMAGSVVTSTSSR